MTAYPRMDVRILDDKIIVTADVPGVPKEAINLTLDHGVLTLSGERKSEVTDKDRGYFERSYGRFERSVRLPDTAKAEGVAARYENGVLSIEIPKEKEREPMRVQIM